MRKSKHYLYVGSIMHDLGCFKQTIFPGIGYTAYDGMRVIKPNSQQTHEEDMLDNTWAKIPPEHIEVVYAETGILWHLDLSGLEYNKLHAKYILDCDLRGIKGKIPIQDIKNETLRIANCKLPRMDFLGMDTTECFFRGLDLSLCSISAKQIFSSVGMDDVDDDEYPWHLTKFPRIKIEKQDIPYVTKDGHTPTIPGLDLRNLYSLDLGIFTHISCQHLKLPSRVVFKQINFISDPYLHFILDFTSLNANVDMRKVDFPYYLLLLCSRLSHARIKTHFPRSLPNFPEDMLPIEYDYTGADLSCVENFPSELFFCKDTSRYFCVTFPAGTDFSIANLRQFEGAICAGPCKFSEDNFRDVETLCRDTFKGDENINMTKESADALSAETLVKIAKTEMRVEGMNIFNYITLRAKDNSPIGAKMKQIALRCL